MAVAYLGIDRGCEDPVAVNELEAVVTCWDGSVIKITETDFLVVWPICNFVYLVVLVIYWLLIARPGL